MEHTTYKIKDEPKRKEMLMPDLKKFVDKLQEQIRGREKKENATSLKRIRNLTWLIY